MWGAVQSGDLRSSEPKILSLREGASGPRQRKDGERTETTGANGVDPGRHHGEGEAWRSWEAGAEPELAESRPRAWTKRAVHRGINKEPGPGSVPPGPATIVPEGLSFSKALSLHGFLGG